MKKSISLLLIICVIFSCFSVSFITVSANEDGRGIVYIAANGKDSSSGSVNDPLATFEAAQKKVREMKASGQYPKGIVVYVRGGNYNFTKPVIFTEQDSGTKEAPIVWRNYPDEKVSISGGVSVPGSKFKKVTDKAVLDRIIEKSACDSIYSLDLKEYGVKDPGDTYLYGAYSYYKDIVSSGLVNQPMAPSLEVFFNGKALTNARYPNNSYMKIEKVIEPGYNRDDPDAVPFGTPIKVSVDDDRMKYWKTAPEGSIMMYGFWRWDWGDQTIPLAEIDAKNNALKMKWHSMWSAIPGQAIYAYNLLEELDNPGEYFVDRENCILYIVPPGDIDSANISMSIMEEELFRLNSADYLTFKGLNITGTRNSVFVLNEGSSYNNIIDCDISFTAKYAVIIRGDHNSVADCYIHDVDGGVATYGGEISTLTLGENTIVNNHFENFARLTKAYMPAVMSDGIGDNVFHNEIHGSTHQAIAFGGNLNKIMYNKIYDVLQDTDDAGAIYGGLTWISRGNEIKYNYIIGNRNTPSTGSVGNFGIYADGGLCEQYICGNILENFEGEAMLINGGWDNVVLNNYFINCGSGVDVSAIMRASITTFYTAHYPRLEAVEDKIMNSPQWKEAFPTFFDMMSVSDDEKAKPRNNVVANNIAYNGKIATSQSYSNADVQNNLEVKNNVGFNNINEHDYNLRADSYVFSKIPGFKAVPFTRMGRLDDLAYGRVQDVIVLSVDSPKAMVNGEVVAIDENSSVKPFIDGDRTYLPLRFLSEKLGAAVSFSDEDGKIKISDASVNLELQLNSNEVKKNGESLTLDKPPVEIEGRTFVPLRQVSELLDKQIFWHDSGFIAISDDAALFDSVEESEENIIRFLNEKIKIY